MRSVVVIISLFVVYIQAGPPLSIFENERSPLNRINTGEEFEGDVLVAETTSTTEIPTTRITEDSTTVTDEPLTESSTTEETTTIDSTASETTVALENQSSMATTTSSQTNTPSRGTTGQPTPSPFEFVPGNVPAPLPGVGLPSILIRSAQDTLSQLSTLLRALSETTQQINNVVQTSSRIIG